MTSREPPSETDPTLQIKHERHLMLPQTLQGAGPRRQCPRARPHAAALGRAGCPFPGRHFGPVRLPQPPPLRCSPQNLQILFSFLHLLLALVCQRCRQRRVPVPPAGRALSWPLRWRPPGPQSYGYKQFLQHKIYESSTSLNPRSTIAFPFNIPFPTLHPSSEAKAKPL